jgi:hypothetical protein
MKTHKNYLVTSAGDSIGVAKAALYCSLNEHSFIVRVARAQGPHQAIPLLEDFFSILLNRLRSFVIVIIG